MLFQHSFFFSFFLYKYSLGVVRHFMEKPSPPQPRGFLFLPNDMRWVSARVRSARIGVVRWKLSEYLVRSGSELLDT